MELRTYLGVLRKNLILIVVAAVLGVGGGALVYYLTPKTFQSSVQFYVSTPLPEGTSAQSAGQFAQARVSSYILLLTSDELAKRVINVTGLKLSQREVASRISATSEVDTVLITATVSDTSGQQSLLIARGMAETFGDMVDDLDNQGRDNAIVVINVVSGPTLRATPISPRLNLDLAVGLAVGLALGLAAGVLRELLDTSVRSLELAHRLVGAPVLGTISYNRNAERSPLIIGGESNSIRAESYRQLRTNLQFIDVDRSTNVLMLTSSVPLEGKSSVAVNLGLTFVEAGERVLLIEADLRRPRLSEYLDMEREVGLSNVLAGQVELADVIQPWGADGLFLLPSGVVPPNPSELLGSRRMQQLVTSVRADFDRVIIDTSPVLPVTDAAVVSALVDGVLFIIRHGRTTRQQVKLAADALHTVNARIVGTVLNARKLARSDAVRYGSEEYQSTAVVLPAAQFSPSRTSQPSPADGAESETRSPLTVRRSGGSAPPD